MTSGHEWPRIIEVPSEQVTYGFSGFTLISTLIATRIEKSGASRFMNENGNVGLPVESCGRRMGQVLLERNGRQKSPEMWPPVNGRLEIRFSMLISFAAI